MGAFDEEEEEEEEEEEGTLRHFREKWLPPTNKEDGHSRHFCPGVI